MDESRKDFSITEAAAAGDLLAVRKIIDEGGDVDERDSDGCSALLHAVKNGHNHVIQGLLASDANAEFSDALGLSALHVACLKGNLKAVQLLLNYGCDPNGVLHPRAPPPMSFAMQGNEDIIPYLISCGAEVLNERTIGEVPLLNAVSQCDVNLFKKMLQEGRPDLSFTSRNGNSIFEHLFKSCSVKIEMKNCCELLETLLDYVKQTEIQLPKMKEALNKAMPCLIRRGCMECFNKALPLLVNVNHKYDNEGTNMLQIAMTSETCWHTCTRTSYWTLQKTNLLDDCRIEMSRHLIEAGASLSSIKENVIGKRWNVQDHPILHRQQTTIMAYAYYIQAWGGWYPSEEHSEVAFRDFALRFMDDSARMACWAGYKPSEQDVDSLPGLRDSLMRKTVNHWAISEEDAEALYSDDLIDELKTEFGLNPRTLVNLAAICIRRQLCDNILFKVKALHLPQSLQDYVTLEFILKQMPSYDVNTTLKGLLDTYAPHLVARPLHHLPCDPPGAHRQVINRQVIVTNSVYFV